MTFKATIAALALASGAAHASCSIYNDTGWSFTVESSDSVNGNLSAHSTSSFSGPFKAKSSDGKTFSGVCQGDEHYTVKDQGGVAVIKKD